MASLMRPTMLRQSVMASRRVTPISVAAFHNSSRRAALVPPGPQRIQGGINDPAPIPEPSSVHGSYHWIFDRVLAAGLIPLTVAPFAAGSLNPTLDAIFGGALLIHSHMGFQQAIIDYFPPRYPKLHQGFMWLLRLATVAAGVGLYEFETNDVGITEAVKRVWKA